MGERMNNAHKPQDGELWYVEAYDRKTGRVIERQGPMNGAWADCTQAAMSLDYGDKYATRQVNVVYMANKSRQCNA